MIEALWNPNNETLVWALNVVLQVALVAASAVLIGLTLRRSPAARYWLLCSALLVVTACPILAAIVQSSGISLIFVDMAEIGFQAEMESSGNGLQIASLKTETQVPQHNSMVSVDNTSQQLPRLESEAPALAFEQPGTTQANVATTTAAISTSTSISAPLPPFASITPASTTARLLRVIGRPVLAAWAIVAALLLVRLFIQWYRLSLLLRTARPNTDVEFAAAFQQTCTALGVRPGRMSVLVFSADVSGPIAAGVRSAKVVLPESLARQIDSAQLKEILIHEVAHIVRGDQLVVLLQNIVGAVFWIHPFVRMLNRQLAKAREEVCDNYVLSVTDAPSYSRTLLTLAQLLQKPRPVTGAVGLFTSRGKLEQRVGGLLDEQRSRVTRLSRATFALIGALSLALAMTAAFGTIALATAAQDDDSESAAKDVAAVDVDELNEPDDEVVVRGIVRKPDGSPAAGATVSSVAVVFADFERQCPEDFEPKLTEVTTDANGRFEVTVQKKPFGDLDFTSTRFDEYWKHATIAASLNGFGGDWIRFSDVKRPDELVLALVDDMPLRGRVVDLEGQPLAGVPVAIGGLSRSSTGDLSDWVNAIKAGENAQYAYRHASHSTDPELLGVPGNVVTDADGRFVIHGMGRERQVTLQIVGENVAFQQADALTREMAATRRIMFAEETQQVFGADFVFSAAPSQPVEGTVVDADTGKPLADVEVKADRFAGSMMSGLGHLKTSTDKDGRFRLLGLPKSQPDAKDSFRFNYLALRPNDDQPYLMRRMQVAVGQGLETIDMTIELHRGIWITGRVTNNVTGESVLGRADALPALSQQQICDSDPRI